MNIASRIKIAFCGLLVAGLFAPAVSAAEPAEFSLPDLDGRVHHLSDYRGKWVLVNYWATWCPPCLEELPELEVFHNNNSETRAVVLGVNMESIGRDTLRGFVEEQFLSFPILLAGPQPEEMLGKVPGLPTSYLINPLGEVVARQVGPITAQAIETFISRHDAKEKTNDESTQKPDHQNKGEPDQPKVASNTSEHGV